MDNFWILAIATAIEGACAVKIARKFNDGTPAWKFFIPIYNVLIYGKFSLVSPRYLAAVVSVQALDLLFQFVQDLHPLIASSQLAISSLSFFLWAVLVARIAVRFGQGYWSYLAALVLSAVASNLVVVALLYVLIPSFSAVASPVPLWANMLAIVIASLPFLSLAFDKTLQQ